MPLDENNHTKKNKEFTWYEYLASSRQIETLCLHHGLDEVMSRIDAGSTQTGEGMRRHRIDPAAMTTVKYGSGDDVL